LVFGLGAFSSYPNIESKAEVGRVMEDGNELDFLSFIFRVLWLRVLKTGDHATRCREKH